MRTMINQTQLVTWNDQNKQALAELLDPGETRSLDSLMEQFEFQLSRAGVQLSLTKLPGGVRVPYATGEEKQAFWDAWHDVMARLGDLYDDAIVEEAIGLVFENHQPKVAPVLSQFSMDLDGAFDVRLLAFLNPRFCDKTAFEDPDSMPQLPVSHRDTNKGDIHAVDLLTVFSLLNPMVSGLSFVSFFDMVYLYDRSRFSQHIRSGALGSSLSTVDREQVLDALVDACNRAGLAMLREVMYEIRKTPSTNPFEERAFGSRGTIFEKLSESLGNLRPREDFQSSTPEMNEARYLSGIDAFWANFPWIEIDEFILDTNTLLETSAKIKAFRDKLVTALGGTAYRSMFDAFL